MGSIYASRISTCLHAGTQENYKLVEQTLLAMNVPMQALFLLLIWILNLGHLDFTAMFALSYFIVSMISVSTCDGIVVKLLVNTEIRLFLHSRWANP